MGGEVREEEAGLRDEYVGGRGTGLDHVHRGREEAVRGEGGELVGISRKAGKSCQRGRAVSEGGDRTHGVVEEAMM